VFAGAAREAVFSNRDVIRRVNADFIPVALKAGHVNNPPADLEGLLYREIARSKPAPQGICVVNSAGKVLDWALMFDDDKSVLAFLDHCLKRFAVFPDARKPVAAERYMKFPSQKLADIEDNGKVLAMVDRHPEAKTCPGTTRVQRGTVLARVFGRALDKHGKLMADTVRQEHYVEDRFHVPVGMQQELAAGLRNAGAGRFRMADGLTRLLVSHAFLGQLDVNPLGGAGGKGVLKHCAFWAQKIDGESDGAVRIHLAGKSEAAGGSSDGEGGDGRLWQHEVKLTWKGIIELKKDRICRLLLVARGSEKLKWGNALQGLSGRGDVTHLPAGHAIDLACGVRYGIIGEPVPDAETGNAEEVRAAQEGGPVPDEGRKPLVQALGGAFIIFRDKVQEELMLSDEQEQKLLESFPHHVQATMKVFEKIKDAKPGEREKAMQEHRQRSDERLSAFLRDVLQPKQQKRLFQLQLQQAGAFALLGRNEAFAPLRVTNEQRKQIMNVVEDMHKKIEPLIKDAQSGGNPDDIMPRIMKVRQEHESRITAILSDIQRGEWTRLLGKPFELDK